MKGQHPHKHDRKMCLKKHIIIAPIGIQLGASNEDCFRLPQTTMLTMLRCSSFFIALVVLYIFCCGDESPSFQRIRFHARLGPQFGAFRLGRVPVFLKPSR